MKRTRIKDDGTMVQMGKNKSFPGWYLKHFTYDGEQWIEDSVAYFATEYETLLNFEK